MVNAGITVFAVCIERAETRTLVVHGSVEGVLAARDFGQDPSKSLVPVKCFQLHVIF